MQPRGPGGVPIAGLRSDQPIKQPDLDNGGDDVRSDPGMRKMGLSPDRGSISGVSLTSEIKTVVFHRTLMQKMN